MKRGSLVCGQRDGTMNYIGTDVDKILLPMRRFSRGGDRAVKKQGVIEKLAAFLRSIWGWCEGSFLYEESMGGETIIVADAYGTGEALCVLLCPSGLMC
jgi:hypothetical protein